MLDPRDKTVSLKPIQLHIMSSLELTAQKPSEAKNAAPEADIPTRDRDVGSGSDEPPAKKARLEGNADSENTVCDARDRGIAPIKAEYVTLGHNQVTAG